MKTLEQETIKGACLVVGGEEGGSNHCNGVTGLNADNRGACAGILRQQSDALEEELGEPQSDRTVFLGEKRTDQTLRSLNTVPKRELYKDENEQHLVTQAEESRTRMIDACRLQ